MVVLRRERPVDYSDWKPPLQRLARRPRLKATWESWAGDVWEVSNPASRVFALEGVTGLGMGEPVHHLTERIQGGARHDGFVDPAGEVFFPVRVDGPTYEAFVDVNARFGQSLDPEHESVLRFTAPDGKSRHLPLRYKSGGEPAEGPRSVLLRRATYPLQLLAADPYWRGDVVSWKAENLPAYPPDWQPGTGGNPALRHQTSFFPGPPWRASTGSPTYPPDPGPGSPQFPHGVTLHNPGDVGDVSHAWWRIGAPFTGFRVGVSESVLEVQLTKTAGYVEVDMDPRRQTVRDENGADVADEAFVEVDWSPIPKGEVPLTVAIFGRTPGASVEMRFHPRYRSGLLVAQ